MNEITEVVPLKTSPNPASGDPATPADTGAKDISVYLTNGRLQITADVDAAGLKKLKALLAKYEEILDMLN